MADKEPATTSIPSKSVSFEEDPLLQNDFTSLSARSSNFMLSERSTELSQRLSVIQQQSQSDSSEKSSNRWGQIASILRAGSSFHDVLKLITLTERQKALSHEGVGEAAFLIRDAVLGNVENPAKGAYDPYIDPEKVLHNAVSVMSRRICSSRPVIRTLYGVSWVLLLLSFVEPPSWCRNDQYSFVEHDGCQVLLTASGVPASNVSGDNGDMIDEVSYYPNSNSMLLTLGQSACVEAIGLALILLIFILRFGRDGMSFKIYLRPGPSQWNRIIQLFCLTGLTIGLCTENRLFQPYLRLALLVSFLQGVQRDMGVLIKMMPEIFNVLTLLGLFMAFYAWFACCMFVGTEQGQKHFPSLVEALWTLYICVTTANYPDVMMPSYNENRWSALYFVSFMILSFFFLMNVVLAGVVSEYDSAMQQRRDKRRAFASDNLKKAFAILDPEGTGRIGREPVMGLFLILNEDFPEFRTLSDDDTKLLFAILDKDGTNTISEEEFMDFGNVLLIEFTKTSEYETFVQRNFPKLFRSSRFQYFCGVVKSNSFELAIDAILVLNAVVIAIQSYPELSGAEVDLDPKYWDGSIDTAWELVESIFTGIYTLEVLLKFLVLGRKKYFESTKNVFDFTITLLAVISSAIVYYPNDVSDSRIIRMIVLARVLRLTRLLTSMKRFQLIGSISAEILPAARNVVLLLFLLMYLFSAIGVSVLGGYISRDPNNRLSYLVLGTEFAENDYWANNFNDMISGMNVLFNLLVVNNWTECEIGFEAATQSKLVRFFFLGFHVLGVILVNNLVIAFIINEFLTHLATFRERTEAEIVGQGEAILYHRKAVFEGSTVTGTKTDLHGNYIARIRHMGEERRDHDKLRKLFTQTSSANSEREGN